MKNYLFLFLLFSSIHAGAQIVSGDLLDEKRSLLTETNFTVMDSETGIIFMNIAVNRLGVVTSAKVDSEGTTVISTPSRIKAVQFAKKLKFQEGTYFPEFHHARIKVVLYQPD